MNRIYLHVTFHKIKRSNSHMSETTAEDTTSSTSSVKLRRVHLDLSKRLTRSRNHQLLLIFWN
ncbi:hypothetical protein Hanom_Chr17g01559921 [Helianthus anomalus]